MSRVRKRRSDPFDEHGFGPFLVARYHSWARLAGSEPWLLTQMVALRRAYSLGGKEQGILGKFNQRIVRHIAIEAIELVGMGPWGKQAPPPWCCGL
jgi:hypothetical protein